MPKLVQTIIDANTNVAQKATGVNTQSMQAISKTKKRPIDGSKPKGNLCQ